MTIKRSSLLPDPLPPGYRLRKTQRGTVLAADLDLLGRIYDAFALVADARRNLRQIAEILFEDGLPTRDGLAAAKAKGSRPGRPPLDREKLEAALLLMKGGMSPTRAARQVGLGRSTLYREIQGQPLPGSP